MTASRRRRSILARLAGIREKRATPEAAPAAAAASAPAAEPVTETAPPRREHLYGSTYSVQMSFEDLMRTRGYLGETVLRRLVAPSNAEQQRNTALRRAGYAPDEVMWPSE